MDTQWPRYEVFVLERPGAPYEHAGSVHAPDSEMALQNGRDVFARRPEVFSMWAVPARLVYSRTREELAQHGLGEEAFKSETPESYHVCWKAKAASTQTLLGQVEASSPIEALERGLRAFLEPNIPPEQQPFAWWVFPAGAVIESQVEDVEAFFAPARDKSFRLATDFRTHTAMRGLKKPGQG
jgi:phenylacetate-CoA oxygenase PaaH subunit